MNLTNFRLETDSDGVALVTWDMPGRSMNVINAVAQFERELLIERTLSGQARARAQGVPFGRKPTFDEAGRAAVLAKLKDGANVAEVARAFNTTRQTILRVRDHAPVGDPLLKFASPRSPGKAV